MELLARTARRLMIGVLFVAFATLAPGQSDTWRSDIDAGSRAYDQGHYADAESRFAAAVKAAEEFGPTDPRLALSLNSLALLYRAQGRYAEAEPLYKRSLAIWEKSLGSEHSDVATGLSNLASLYQAQGKYAEAEPLYKRSLAIREKTLGPEHPDVATSLENYAALLQESGRVPEAELMKDRARVIRAKFRNKNSATK